MVDNQDALLDTRRISREKRDLSRGHRRGIVAHASTFEAAILSEAYFPPAHRSNIVGSTVGVVPTVEVAVLQRTTWKVTAGSGCALHIATSARNATVIGAPVMAAGAA